MRAGIPVLGGLKVAGIDRHHFHLVYKLDRATK
jgi:hypothetical protein